MGSFETPDSKESEVAHESSHEQFSENFFELLEKDPSAKEVSQTFSRYFNVMKGTIEESYQKTFKGMWEGRPEAADLFVEKAVTDFVTVRDELLDLVDVGNFSEEEQEYIVHAAQKNSLLFSTRAILSFHASQDKAKTRGLEESLIKRQESTVMLRSLAELILENPNMFAEIESGFDRTGQKVFGEEYERIKIGLMSLVNSCYGLRSFGYDVYFSSPVIDTKNGIDLFCVSQKELPDQEDELSELLRGNFSMEDLYALPEDKRSHIMGVQVKSGRDIIDLYGDAYLKYQKKHVSVSELLKEMAMEQYIFDGIDEAFMQKTYFTTNQMQGIFGNQVESILFTHQGGKENERFRFSGEAYPREDPKRAKIADITQDALLTFKRNSRIPMGYIVVNYHKEPPAQNRAREFY